MTHSVTLRTDTTGHAELCCPTCGHALTCAACTGRRGGASTSPKKAAAAKVNASKPRHARKARQARTG